MLTFADGSVRERRWRASWNERERDWIDLENPILMKRLSSPYILFGVAVSSSFVLFMEEHGDASSNHIMTADDGSTSSLNPWEDTTQCVVELILAAQVRVSGIV